MENGWTWYWKVIASNEAWLSKESDVWMFEIEQTKEYQIKVYPWSRSVDSLANFGELRLYSGQNLMYKFENILTNGSWLWEFTWNIEVWIYTIVYKWQSHLASYISGMQITWWMNLFDFTTWNDLYNVQNYSLSEDNGFKYQFAWDLKSVAWVYDFMVNGNDISIITTSWFVDVEFLDPRDLNGDMTINVSDLSIIWVNFEKTDLFYDKIFTW